MPLIPLTTIRSTVPCFHLAPGITLTYRLGCFLWSLNLCKKRHLRSSYVASKSQHPTSSGCCFQIFSTCMAYNVYYAPPSTVSCSLQYGLICKRFLSSNFLFKFWWRTFSKMPSKALFIIMRYFNQFTIWAISVLSESGLSAYFCRQSQILQK